MVYIDMGSNTYKAFQDCADQYAISSPNGVMNGSARMSAVEMNSTRLTSELYAAKARIDALESQVKTVISILDGVKDVLKSNADNMEAVLAALELEPMVQLVDDEFFAAAADPEKYRRGTNADHRSTVHTDSSNKY